MKRLVPIIVIAVILAGAAYYAYVRSRGERAIKGPVLRARFLDARFGNAIVLRTPEGGVIVIDPPSGREGRALSELLAQEGGYETIVVLTDPTPDNAAVLADLQKPARVTKIIRPELGSETQSWKRMPARSEAWPFSETPVSAGHKLRLSPTVVLEALGRHSRTDNTAPLTLLIRYGSKSILLLPDIGDKGESHLISSGQNLASNVLVVGQQGVSLELLSMVRPEIVVINSAASPTLATDIRLSPRNTGAALYRTYKDGIIEIDTNGRSIQVQTGGGEP